MRPELDRSDAARLDLKQGAGGVCAGAGAARAARHTVVDRCAGRRRFPARSHHAGAAHRARDVVGGWPGLHAGSAATAGTDHPGH
ncbi:hypothetical protein G6F59_018836 [Rhizopus arrhizus]|nr:hypothetical protein G6F59_018836 [Rhizopus arrhizus]